MLLSLFSFILPVLCCLFVLFCAYFLINWELIEHFMIHFISFVGLLIITLCYLCGCLYGSWYTSLAYHSQLPSAIIILHISTLSFSFFPPGLCVILVMNFTSVWVANHPKDPVIFIVNSKSSKR